MNILWIVSLISNHGNQILQKFQYTLWPVPFTMNHKVLYSITFHHFYYTGLHILTFLKKKKSTGITYYWVHVVIRVNFKFPCRNLTYMYTCTQWRRHWGGRGGNCPPYDFEGKKGEEGKRRKGRKKKRKKRRGKEKNREERKKENQKKKKKPVIAFCVQDNDVFIHKFSKIFPIGWVPARSLRSLALTHCWQILSAPGQFHGKVDMALKFQVYHITKQLLIMFYPYVEVKKTEIILQIGRIFSEI